MIISSPSDSPAVPVPAFDDDDGGFVGYDPLLFAQSESAMDLVADDDDSPFFTSPPVQYTPPPPPPIDVAGPIADPVRSSAFSFEDEERSFGDGFVASSGTILPPPTEMSEGALVLREWMRQNAIRLELKDKTEKELLSQIIDEANEFKDEFYKKRLVSLETNKGIFREKEKLFLSSHEKFYAEADKHYWETIAELVLNEVPTIVKKNTNKDQQKKHSIDVIQGPKPGNPADLSRMQEILLKLKDNTPPHLDLSPPPTTTTAATKGGRNEAATPGASRVISPQPTALFGKMYAVN